MSNLKLINKEKAIKGVIWFQTYKKSMRAQMIHDLWLTLDIVKTNRCQAHWPLKLNFEIANNNKNINCKIHSSSVTQSLYSFSLYISPQRSGIRNVPQLQTFLLFFSLSVDVPGLSLLIISLLKTLNKGVIYLIKLMYVCKLKALRKELSRWQQLSFSFIKQIKYKVWFIVKRRIPSFQLILTYMD